MSHEIQEHDNEVLYKQPAWNGLGDIIDSDMTPTEALEGHGLDWQVIKQPLFRECGNYLQAIDNRVALVREDIDEYFGSVSPSYSIFQNRDLAEFCEALAEQDDTVSIESAGSIRNGQKVWFLLRGESFSVREEDEVCPYILVSNAHDGKNAACVTPTTIRVVCSNTLHAVVPDVGSDRKRMTSKVSFSINHFSTLPERLEEAKTALKLYGRQIEEHRTLVDVLASTDVSQDIVRRFFAEQWSRDFEPIPANPQSKAQQRAYARAQLAWGTMERNFEEGLTLAGPTTWNMFNAYSDLVQHRRRRATEARREEVTRGAVLYGIDAERTIRAFQAALSLAV